jgi:hypothetical protein
MEWLWPCVPNEWQFCHWFQQAQSLISWWQVVLQSMIAASYMAFVWPTSVGKCTSALEICRGVAREVNSGLRDIF